MHSFLIDNDNSEDIGHSFLIDDNSEDIGARLDSFAHAKLEVSRNFMQRLIMDGCALVNGVVQKANYRIKPGDLIVVNMPLPTNIEILPEDLNLDIVYEDEHVIVVDKPKGMVVHPAPGHSNGTMVNGLLHHCAGSLSGINGVMRPGIVHRIDKDTSGLLVAAKNDRAHNALAKQFADHSIARQYYAIVHGGFKNDEGTIDAPIGRHKINRKKMTTYPHSTQEGKWAITNYHVIERWGNYSLISCRLKTGRTHQIRVHMASIGHPLLGDEIYGGKGVSYKLQVVSGKGKVVISEGTVVSGIGQVLHARLLGFIHPTCGEYMEFFSPLPEYFQKLVSLLSKQYSTKPRG